jgi:hypothetical protein
MSAQESWDDVLPSREVEQEKLDILARKSGHSIRHRAAVFRLGKQFCCGRLSGGGIAAHRRFFHRVVFDDPKRKRPRGGLHGNQYRIGVDPFLLIHYIVNRPDDRGMKHLQRNFNGDIINPK